MKFHRVVFLSLLLFASSIIADTFEDDFNTFFFFYSYNNSSGTEDWSGDYWIESGDDGSSFFGDIRVSSEELNLRSNNNAISRSVDLGAYVGGEGTFSFDYSETGFDNNNDYIVIEIQAAGSGWQTLGVLRGSSVNSGSVLYVIDSYIAADTEIRISTSTSSSMNSGDQITIDNVSINVTAASTFPQYLDQFESAVYNNSDGIEDWSSETWQEVGDDNSPLIGGFSSDIFITGGALRLRDDNNSISRNLDLTNYLGGTGILSFDYSESGFDNNNDYLVIEVRGGGSAWQTLGTLQGSSVGTGTSSYSIDSFIADDTEIRFRTSTSNSMRNSDYIDIDNVAVTLTGGAGVCSSFFPDGVSSHSAGGYIQFDWGSVVENSPDNILDTVSLLDNSGGVSCDTTACGSSGVNTEAITYSTFPGGTDINIGFNVTQSLAPGDYGSLTTASSVILNLSPGDYTFDGDINFGFSTSIVVSGSGTVRIFNNGNVSLSSSTAINAGGTADQLVLYTLGSVNFGSAATVNAFVYANTDAIFNNGAILTGALSATNTTLGSASSIVYDQAALSITDFDTLCEPVVTLPDPVAHYQFEELAWNNTAGEVIDSANGLNGRGLNGATTSDVSPPDSAISGDPGTCRFGEFDGNNDYVIVEDNDALDLSAELTVGVWIYPRAFPSSGIDTILSKDENYEFHVNTSQQIFWWWNDSSGNTRTLTTTGSALSADTWYHVAIVYSNGSQQIYIDGVERASSTNTGNLRTNADPLFIGTDLNFVGSRNFNGAIDEVAIYDQAFNADEIEALMLQTFPCNSVSGPDHFDIDHNSSAIYCQPTAITVTAENADGSSYEDYDGTITLDTDTGIGTWSLTSGNGTLIDVDDNDGIATYSYSIASGADDNGVAVFSLDHSDTPIAVTTPLAMNIVVEDGSITDDDLEGLLNFSASGFTLTGSPLTNGTDPIDTNLPVATQTAGTDFNVYIAAFGQTPTDASCGIIEAYNGNKAITFTHGYSDPTTGTVSPTIDAQSIASAITVNFVNGQASVVEKYKDVGEIILSARDGQLIGLSNPFVVRPAYFDIALGTDWQSEDGLGNPDPDGSVFAVAGSNFSVEVTARDSEGDLTPNYGNEATAEGIALTYSLAAPLAGDTGSLIGSLTKNTLTNVFEGNYQWSEVGIIDLIADVADGQYLEEGGAATTLNHVGRFVPDSFNVTASILNRTDSNTQPLCGDTFTFLDEELSISFDIEAQNALGARTSNYTGDFAKLNESLSLGSSSGNDTASVNAVAVNGSEVFYPGERLSGAVPAMAVTSGGQVGASFSVQIERQRVSGLLQAEPPLLNTELAFNVIDSDGVESSGVTSITMPVAGNTELFTSAGTTQFYYGRLVFESAAGSELLPLPAWVHTEACLAVDSSSPAICTSWQDLNRTQNPVIDSCSLVTVAAPSDVTVLGLWQGSTDFSGANPALFYNFDALQNRGGAGMSLSYVGSANGGDFWLPELASATLENYHPYLLLQQGLVTFGSYRGHDRIIYWREKE